MIESIKGNDNLLNQVINSLDTALFLVAKELHLTPLNDSAREFCNGSSARDIDKVCRVEDIEEAEKLVIKQLVEDTINTGKNSSKYIYKKNSGNRSYYHLKSSFITKDTVLLAFEDITSIQDDRLKLKEMAIRDQLTALYNRRHLFDLFEQELKRVKRFNRHLSIMLLDIDYFKRVNDNYGHPKGDFVLKQLSKVIKREIRSIDILGRYGGEEFMLILPETDLHESYFVAERIRKDVENYDFDKISITISIGVSNYEYGDNIKTMIEKADKALYRAKNTGRNRVELASGGYNEEG